MLQLTTTLQSMELRSQMFFRAFPLTFQWMKLKQPLLVLLGEAELLV
jgi:hypothetical protein